jgi:hypothetical protein
MSDPTIPVECSMRTLLVLVGTVVSACRGPMAPAPPADSGIIAKSHAFLDSVDRGDVAAVAAQLGTNYIHFEGKYADATEDLTSLRRDRRIPIHPRSSRLARGPRNACSRAVATPCSLARRAEAGRQRDSRRIRR